MLANKIVMITGATSGLGRATALRCAKEGAVVIGCGRRENLGLELVKEIEESGGKSDFFTVDVTQEDNVKDMVSSTVQKHGRIDGLFNNAGIPQRGLIPLTRLPTHEFQRVQNINVLGAFLCLKHTMIEMQKTGGGSIVNCSSIAGLIGGADMGAYFTSKFALEGLMLSAAAEGAPLGIRVNNVNPGPIRTDIFKVLVDSEVDPKEVIDGFGGKTKLGRAGEPDEVAGPVAFLLSDQASYITGASLTIDGGVVRVPLQP